MLSTHPNVNANALAETPLYRVEPLRKSRVFARRGATRRSLRASVRVECRRGFLGLGKNLVECPLDVSETGMQVLVDQVLEVGEEIEVELTIPTYPRSIRKPARVVRVEALEGPRCRVGLHFDRPLSYRDFQNLTQIHLAANLN